MYRRSSSGKSYYRIDSEAHLLEIQQVGSRWLKHELHAAILPERLLIADIIACAEGHFVTINAVEFAEILFKSQH